MSKYILRRDSTAAKLRINYEKELNPEQLDAVLHGDGPCLVLAGAGSGKTRTIVYRVAYLLEKGIRPDEILLVTFTNKAAREMLDRITKLFGQFPKGLWGGTFHHIAHILLRKYAKRLGFDPNFTILDQEDALSLLKLVVKEIHPEGAKGRFPSANVLHNMISLSRNTRFPISHILEKRNPHFLQFQTPIEAIQKRFAEKKKQSNCLDFDDLLEKFRDLLDQDEQAKTALSRMFRYILVDEYQDTNRLQGDIITRLAGTHNNILVVGDDAQSIYSFRGAEIQNILQFPKLFPSAKTFRIETNYRSTPEILNLSNHIIERNTKQYKKTLRSVKAPGVQPSLVQLANSSEEAEFIVQRISELHQEGMPLSEMAVLFRASHHSQMLEFELTRREIPYEYRGGVRFFERAHIKDVLAHLKVLENPKDEISWYRILLHQEGIGEMSAKKIIDELVRFADLPDRIAEFTPQSVKGDKVLAGWKTLRRELASILKLNSASPMAMIEAILKGSYGEYLEAEYPNADERRADLETLAEFANRYEGLSAFLAEVTLQESFTIHHGDEDKKDEDQIVLSTIHQAKGLEWEAVFIINMNSSAFPHPKSVDEGNIEEERRLFYVAATRARQYLTLTYAMSSGSPLGGYLHLHSPSPFLQELPPSSYEAVDIVVENGENP